jgi:hypothetical protein
MPRSEVPGCRGSTDDYKGLTSNFVSLQGCKLLLLWARQFAANANPMGGKADWK